MLHQSHSGTSLLVQEVETTPCVATARPTEPGRDESYFSRGWSTGETFLFWRFTYKSGVDSAGREQHAQPNMFAGSALLVISALAQVLGVSAAPGYSTLPSLHIELSGPTSVAMLRISGCLRL